MQDAPVQNCGRMTRVRGQGDFDPQAKITPYSYIYLLTNEFERITFVVSKHLPARPLESHFAAVREAIEMLSVFPTLIS